MNFTPHPKFQLGKLAITPLAVKALELSSQIPVEFLSRHQSGDWGELCPEDKKANDEAIAFEGDPDKQQRVLSSYETILGDRVWVITEWDRSITTILLPEDY